MAATRIPFYRVKGTHYECAHAVGSLTSEVIRQRITDDLAEFSILFDFVQTDYGRKIHEDFIEKIRLIYPWYWDEFLGLAEGSKIPLEQILVLNFLNETRTAYYLLKTQNDHQQLENEVADRGCTSVLINRKELSLLHNEDHSIALYKAGYLLEANIQSSSYENGKRQSPNEKFLAFCCAGAIPGSFEILSECSSLRLYLGNAFNVNQHGFVFSINALFPNYVGYGRLPRQILFRALLSVRNQEDLDDLFRIVPTAFGFSVNGGFLQQSYLFNYEIGANLNVQNGNYVSKCLVLNNEQKSESTEGECTVFNYLIHYNHYERLNKIITEQQTLDSTFHRWKRGQELGEISTIDDARRLLGDNENKLYPIFRCPSDIDNSTVTLCTVHVNFRTLEFLVYEHNPKEDKPPTFTYDLKTLLCFQI